MLANLIGTFASEASTLARGITITPSQSMAVSNRVVSVLLPHAITTLLLLSLITGFSSAQSSSINSASDVTSVQSIGTQVTSGSTGLAGDVVTYHFDLGRTGWYRNEVTLTLGNVNATTFGKVGFLPVDGKVDAQPLHLNSISVKGQLHDVIYAVTEHDSVYAFDAATGTQLWETSVLEAGERPSDTIGCNQISPEIGITSTPVIDRTLGPHGAIYLVGMTKDSEGHYHQRLHALDITTGVELFGGPQEIQAKYPGTGDNTQDGYVIFDPRQYSERVGLLELDRSTVYLAFTSHCDQRPYTGWVLAYNTTTLKQRSVLNLTPNGSEGAVWMSGSAMAADDAEDIYFLDGNGTFDGTLDTNGFPINGDFGNSFLKLSARSGLRVADYFATYNTIQQSEQDEDLGSGGAIVLPDLYDKNNVVHHLAVGAGKDGNIYVVNRDDMGKYSPHEGNQNAYQFLPNALNAVYSMPAYFTNTLYYGASYAPLLAFGISDAKLSTSPISRTATWFTYPGTTPVVSGTGANAIVWAVENASPAVLHAYNAVNLAQELYNSNQKGARDHFGPGNKFITPIIANGKVYVGTQAGVAMFGLLP